MAGDLRQTERMEIPIEADLLRRFLRAALDHDAIVDQVNELLFEHVVESRYHPSVVAATLPSMLSDLLDAATHVDWQIITDQLIAEAREAIGRDTGGQPPTGADA